MHLPDSVVKSNILLLAKHCVLHLFQSTSSCVAFETSVELNFLLKTIFNNIF